MIELLALDIHPVRLGAQGTLAIPAANPSEARRVVEELLSEDAANHHCFIQCEVRFHSHLAHHLMAAYDMGASPELLKKIYSEEAEDTLPLVSRSSTSLLPVSHEITDDNWTQHLGDCTYYVQYLVFFSKTVRRLGMRLALERYLLDDSDETGTDMLWRLVSGVFHPFILLGYAVEFDSETILAQALAQTAVHDLWGPDSLRDHACAQDGVELPEVSHESSPQSIFAIFQEIYDADELQPVLPYYSFEILHPEDDSPNTSSCTDVETSYSPSIPSPIPSPTISDNDSDISSDSPATPSDVLTTDVPHYSPVIENSFFGETADSDTDHLPSPPLARKAMHNKISVPPPCPLLPLDTSSESPNRLKSHRSITPHHRDALFTKRLLDACEGGTRPSAIHRISRKWWSNLDQPAQSLEQEINQKIRDMTILSILLLTAIPAPPSRQAPESNLKDKHKLDFFLMHILNATHFLHPMHTLLGSRAMEKVLRTLLPTVVMMLLLRGRPKVDVGVVMGYTGRTGRLPGWMEIIEEATHARDSHVLKSVRAMCAAARRYGDSLERHGDPESEYGGGLASDQVLSAASDQVHSAASDQVHSATSGLPSPASDLPSAVQTQVDSTLFIRASTMVLDVMGWLTKGDEAGVWDRCGLGWEEGWDVVDEFGAL